MGPPQLCIGLFRARTPRGDYLRRDGSAGISGQFHPVGRAVQYQSALPTLFFQSLLNPHESSDPGHFPGQFLISSISRSSYYAHGLFSLNGIWLSFCSDVGFSWQLP
jgi:hypothetical protein